MRIALTIITLLLATTSASAQAPATQAAMSPEANTSPQVNKPAPVFMYPHVDAAWQAAQKSGRPVMVFVTAADCHYCKKMYSETLSHPQIAQANNARFETAFVSKETHPDIVAKLGIRAFPTTLVVNPDGTLKDSIRGYLEPRAFAEQVYLGKKPTRQAAAPAPAPQRQ